jgi:hypothetical protein
MTTIKTTKITASSAAAISAKCDLCENESENIVIGPGTEDMKYFCNKHFYNYYFFSLTITALHFLNYYYYYSKAKK